MRFAVDRLSETNAHARMRSRLRGIRGGDRHAAGNWVHTVSLRRDGTVESPEIDDEVCMQRCVNLYEVGVHLLCIAPYHPRSTIPGLDQINRNLVGYVEETSSNAPQTFPLLPHALAPTAK